MTNPFDFIKAIFLGIVEGLTEFLPVSSTAHLLVSSYLIDFNSIANNLFEIVIQIGAILAICVIYRARIFEVICNLNQKKQQKFTLNLKHSNIGIENIPSPESSPPNQSRVDPSSKEIP